MTERAPNTSLAFFFRTALPVLAAALIVMALAAAYALWSAAETDEVAVERQERLIHVVVDQLRAGIAHDQESVTVWDDAVVAVRDRDLEWMHVNLGNWMQTYFGHDEVYVLGTDGAPIYAFADGRSESPARFGSVSATIAPLVQDLRRRLAEGDRTGITNRDLTIGSWDAAVINGHPSIVSMKPIVSDTGDIAQVPGQEALHVSVRHLDGDFLQQMQKDYLLQDLDFTEAGLPVTRDATVALTDRTGRVVGHFNWTPYHPGSTVLARVAPGMLAFLAATLCTIILLLLSLRRRSIKLSASQAEVEHLAAHDQLTGLPNRRNFEKRLDAELARLLPLGEEAAVLYLDLDRFKEVNDALGHRAGDELLQEFGNRLKTLTRPQDVVARLGGDEFTIFCPGIQSREEVSALAEQIVETARQPFSVAGSQAFIGVSVGIAIAPTHGVDRSELTRRADIAMYQAKHAGRSSFAIYTRDMDRSIEARRELEGDLRKALKRDDQLTLHFQPLHSAASSAMTGVEVLLRWKHPTRGWVAPDVFVPIAEEVGLIHELGEWVLSEACRQTRNWPVSTVAVNVSALELSKPGYAMRVANILLRTGADPARIELEVTESTFTAQHGECQSNIRALRELGLRFALDDFGTGFSSLSRLQQLDVDRIKIDRSFVQGFGKNGSDEAIVQAIIDLAKASGLKTTAEGVETETQVDRLRGIGCDDLQGFVFDRPMPADDIERMWKRKGLHVAKPAG